MADLHMPRAAGLALIAALLSPPPLQAQTLDAAKAFTTALYSAYATGSPDYVGANPERTFSPELLALIRKDQANTPAGEVGILDGDPICDCQDAEGLKLTDAKVVEAGKGAYIPLAHRYAGVPEQLNREDVLERMKPWLENPDKPKLGQNLKYDSHIFENHGVKLRGIVHDTLLQSYVFESHKPHDMDTMALRHLGYTTIPFVDVCGKGVNQICFDQVELQRATEYAAEDSDITLRLHHAMIGHVESDKGLNYIYRSIELPTSVVLQKIERNGVLVDADKLAAQSNELAARIMELEQQAYELAGGPFNLGGYCNKEVDALAAKIVVESDTKKRDAMIHIAFKILTNDVSHIPLHQQYLVWGERKNLDIFQRADDQVLFYWANLK